VRRGKTALLTGSFLIAALLSLLAAFGLGDNEYALKARGLWLVRRPIGDIRGITATGSDKRALRLFVDDEGNNGGEWRRSDGGAADRDGMAPLLAALAYLKASYEVEYEAESGGLAEASLAQYGLTEPRMVLRVEYEGGGANRWQLGASWNGGAYLRDEDGGKVYWIDAPRAETLGAVMETFLGAPLDQVDFGRINGIRIQSPRHGEILLNRSESPRSGGDFFWRMFKPYAANAKVDEVEKIIDSAAAGGWLRRAEADDAALGGEAYASVLTFYDAYDRELVMRFEAPVDGRVFCKIDGKPGVYTAEPNVVSVDVVSIDAASVFDMPPEVFVDPALYCYEPASVTEFRFVWGGREHYFISVWEDMGEGGRGQRFILDARVVSGADYHEFARKVSSVSGEGLLWRLHSEGEKEGENGRLGGTLGSMTVRRASPPYEQTLRFREIENAPDDAGVEYDGKALIYVKRADIAALMDAADALAGH
jgi:hypothetical protein